jgi:hypothetical protein
VNWFGSSAVTFGLEELWLGFDEDDDNNDFFVARVKLNFKFGTWRLSMPRWCNEPDDVASPQVGGRGDV